MRREEFLKDHPDIKAEMVAYTDDGEELGNVISLNEDALDIEKGVFFPKDFFVRYDDVAEISDGRLVINRHLDDLYVWQDPNYEGWNEFQNLSQGEEFDIPLYEEELEAQKTSRQIGEVHLRKVVHTEQKTITIPIAREDVIVERLSVDENLESGSSETAFTEDDITIPLMEEDIEIVKHQKIKGILHARKVTHVEQQQLSEEIRKEEVEVEKPWESGGQEVEEEEED